MGILKWLSKATVAKIGRRGRETKNRLQRYLCRKIFEEAGGRTKFPVDSFLGSGAKHNFSMQVRNYSTNASCQSFTENYRCYR